MSAPALIAVAHGSRDPRSAATVTALLDRLRARHEELDVRLAFLDLSAPRLDAVLRDVDDAVVVPLLLGSAYHARVDVPGAVTAAARARPRARVRIADVLGPDRRLERVALRRLAMVGVRRGDPDTGVVLAAAGSSHPPANAAVAAVAERWAREHRWTGARAAFAAAAHPTVPEAITALRAAGAQRIAVASWFLAPGLLPDKVAALARVADPDVALADPLGAAADLADLVTDRFDAAARAPAARVSA